MFTQASVTGKVGILFSVVCDQVVLKTNEELTKVNLQPDTDCNKLQDQLIVTEEFAIVTAWHHLCAALKLTWPLTGAL